MAVVEYWTTRIINLIKYVIKEEYKQVLFPRFRPNHASLFLGTYIDVYWAYDIDSDSP